MSLTRGAFLGGALITSLLGCTPRGDCSLLLAEITTGLAHVKETQSAILEPPSVAQIQATSAAYLQLVDAVEHVPLPAVSTRDLAKQYQDIAIGQAAAYEVLARALQAEDAEKLTSAKKALNTAGANERTLIRKLGERCVAE
jgi:hypothetical protein